MLLRHQRLALGVSSYTFQNYHPTGCRSTADSSTTTLTSEQALFCPGLVHERQRENYCVIVAGSPVISPSQSLLSFAARFPGSTARAREPKGLDQT